MKYRPEINGLRAVAVLPVILFHAGFGFVDGGFVGVDVFFVISGYLITGIIYSEICQKKFSILTFYERRARRILPALTFVSLVSLALAWMWMLPDEFKQLSESLIAVNLFVSNIYFWNDTGYFAGAAEFKPFLHTWTLAIEEQFYLLFPLFMLAIGFLKRNHILILVSLVLLISLALADWASQYHPNTNFYLLPTRAWELLAGSVIAIAMHGRELRSSKRIQSIGGIAGLVLILYSIFFFDESTPFPSLWAVIPILGASLVILFARSDNLAGKLLSFKPLVGIGLISYSAYLWHQPIFVFARERSFAAPSHTDFLLLSLLSIILAYFSWRFVEQPFRQRQRFSRTQIFSGGFAVTLFMIGFGAYGAYSDGIPWRLDKETTEIVNVRNDRYTGTGDCQSMPGHRIPIEDTCEFNKEYSDKIVVWGDSQATPLVAPVTNKADSLAMSVKQFVFTNCLPVAGYTRNDDVDCGRFNDEALASIIDDKDIKMVIMLGRYPLQLKGKRFDNKEGGIEKKKAVYAVPSEEVASENPAAISNRVEAVGKLIRKTVETLIDSGVKVVLIYPVPEAGWDVPEFLAKEKMYGKERDMPLSTSHAVFKERADSAYRQLDLIEDNQNLLKIKPESLFCDTQVPGRCVAQIDGKLVYYDSNHLSKFGASLLVDSIFDNINKTGWLGSQRMITRQNSYDENKSIN